MRAQVCTTEARDKPKPVPCANIASGTVSDAERDCLVWTTLSLMGGEGNRPRFKGGPSSVPGDRLNDARSTTPASRHNARETQQQLAAVAANCGRVSSTVVGSMYCTIPRVLFGTSRLLPSRNCGVASMRLGSREISMHRILFVCSMPAPVRSPLVLARWLARSLVQDGNGTRASSPNRQMGFCGACFLAPSSHPGSKQQAHQQFPGGPVSGLLKDVCSTDCLFPNEARPKGSTRISVCAGKRSPVWVANKLCQSGPPAPWSARVQGARCCSNKVFGD